MMPDIRFASLVDPAEQLQNVVNEITAKLSEGGEHTFVIAARLGFVFNFVFDRSDLPKMSATHLAEVIKEEASILMDEYASYDWLDQVEVLGTEDFE